MKLVTKLNQSDLKLEENTSFNSVSLKSLETNDHLIYRELEDFPLQNTSEIDRLSENIKTLSELNARLSFVTKEIKYLLNIKKF